MCPTASQTRVIWFIIKNMGRRGYQAYSRKAAWSAGALLLAGLAACEPFWNPPEARAQEFIEALVTTPGDMQPLRDIANISPDRNPSDLLDGVSARVARDFLQAVQAQGVTLKFAQSEVKRISVRQRVVTVRVTYLPPGAPVNSEVRFQVYVEKNDQGDWRIARVTGDN